MDKGYQQKKPIAWPALKQSHEMGSNNSNISERTIICNKG